MHLDATLPSYPVISAFCSWSDIRMTKQGVLIVHGIARMERIAWDNFRLLPVLGGSNMVCAFNPPVGSLLGIRGGLWQAASGSTFL